MNERELARALQESASELGLDLSAVARHLDQTEPTVAPAFCGGQGFTVELLVGGAHTLGLVVDLRQAGPELRRMSPVPTVVDQAILKVAPHLVVPTVIAPAEEPQTGASPHGDDK